MQTLATETMTGTATSLNLPLATDNESKHMWLMREDEITEKKQRFDGWFGSKMRSATQFFDFDGGDAGSSCRPYLLPRGKGD